MRPASRTAVAAAVAVAGVCLLNAAASQPAARTAVPAVLAAGGASGTPPGSYTNPVSAAFADTFADPAVIRGHDGLWYAFGTSDPLTEGEGRAHRLPIARSADLIRWTYVGDAVGADALPPYADPASLLWAPDIRYLGGRYVMYYTVTDTKVSDDGFDTAIGAATAPSPTGPWTHADEPVVAPRPAPGGGYFWTIDPAHFTDVDGRSYLYFGSYHGGVWVTELSADGLRAVGAPTRVGINDRFEGAYVVRRGRYYYLFASSANCCAGPATGYSVSVGRATDPRGPFTDADGNRLDASRPGGTPVIRQNGNGWIGIGHNAVVTDLAGQDWTVYHAIHRSDPYLDEPYGINERPMLIDRLDWIDGWPVVRAGAGASEGPQRAPVTTTTVQDDFASGRIAPRWRAGGGDWSVIGVGAAAHLRRTGTGRATLVAEDRLPLERRVEADLRLGEGGAGGVVVADRASAWIDGRALVVEVTAGAHPVRRTAALPAGFPSGAWHNLAVEVRGRELTARLTRARLGDPIAEVSLTSPVPLAGRAGVLAVTGPVDADNVSATRLARPVMRTVPDPVAGRVLPAHSDEFDEERLDDAWTWVRPDAAATVGGGALHWPVQGHDLVGDGNVASVLLRDAPRGDYIVETKLTLDLGEGTVRDFQQAGLIAYVSDDDFARLSHVAIWNTRQVEFGRELPFADRLAFGGAVFGTQTARTWLRLAHRVDPANGEHEFRAGVSRDGRHWVWGGTWTFPAHAAPRIGLVSQGGAEPAVTARFHYFRVHRAVHRAVHRGPGG